MPDPATTDDKFLDGAVMIRQPAHGYRAGLDAVLLAASLEAKPGDRLMELGCGAGAALVMAAARLPGVSILGLEREHEMAQFARENIRRNGLEERVAVLGQDLFDREGPRHFRGVFCNPPFLEIGEGAPPDPARAHAFLTEHPIEDWVLAAVDRLSGGGAFTMIHRADRLEPILRALEGRLGGVELLPVRPRRDRAAKRLLVRARKGSRAPLKLHRGLDLHDAEGRFTPEAEAILRGRAALGWGAPSAGDPV